MRGFVDRVIDGVAVVLLDGGGRAYLPSDHLPPGIEAGNVVDVTVAPLGSMSADEVAELIERLRSGEHRHD